MLATLLVLAADPNEPNYSCGFGDVGCTVNESIARFMYSSALNMAHFMADSIKVAFDSTAPTAANWQSANGQFLFWIQVMLPIVMAVALAQIGIAAILQDWARMRRVVLGAVLGVPLSGVAVWLMQKASTVTDGITTNILSTVQGDGKDSLSSAIGNMFGLTLTADTEMTKFIANGTGINANSFLGSAASNAQHTQAAIGMYVLVLVLVGVMWLASLFLFGAMALRLFGLVVLAALAPIGLMMVGQPKLAVWAERWANVTLGFLVAKPLAAAVIAVAVSLAGNNGSLVGVVVGCVGLFIAAFSPLWATKFMSFASAETTNALAHRPSIREAASRGSTAAAPARSASRVMRRAR